MVILAVSYINDVATVVSPGSEINMFADDIALYRIIKTALNYRALQDDVNSIGSLMAIKHIEFNADKCRTIIVSRKRSNTIAPPLYLNGTQLNQVTSYNSL